MQELLDLILARLHYLNEMASGLPLISQYTGRHTGLVFLGLPLLLVPILFLLIRKRRRTAIKRATVVAATEEIEEIEPEEDEPVPAVVNQESIARYFLKIYKAQLGSQNTARSEIRQFVDHAAGLQRTYELRVLHDKQWQSRRMTVGPAGEESASRSKCFHVIFDDHFVVKVPQKPLTDFEAYLSAIEADQHIANRLEPCTCIVPAVSTVLKMVHPFADIHQAAPRYLEEKYLNWLRKYPTFQEYLKVDGSFVFVMDLSRYFFLSHIVNDIHNLSEKLYEEVVGYPDVIWENHGFEGRYAMEDDGQVEAIRRVFKDFEERGAPLIQSWGKKPFARYVLQRWFLLHLAGRELVEGEKDLTADQLEKTNAMLRAIMQDNRETIEAYRNTIRGCIQTVSVSQSRQQISGLASNLLELLARLRERGVAVRDLKPDNLLVAADKANYPQFLDNPESYSIGLIDVETAVTANAAGSAEIPQPTLGGTPSYATPSHLIPNRSIAAYFTDTQRILYLQDWYATLAIIYEMVTGERLFSKTGKLIIGIKTAMFRNMPEEELRFELFKKASRMFWYCARQEFNEKVRAKQDILKMVEVNLGQRARERLRKEMEKENKRIDERIHALVYSPSAVMSDGARKGLMAAPRQKITLLKMNRKKTKKDDGRLQKMLSDLEALKGESEKNDQFIQFFGRASSTLYANDLLHLMFGVVLGAMYREQWGELLAAQVSGVKDGRGSTNLEATL